MNKTLLKISANSLDFAFATGNNASKRLNPVKIGGSSLQKVIKKEYPTKVYSVADGYFNFITLEEWKEIFYWWGLVLDKLDKRGIRYKQPYRDCDNYSKLFSSLVPFIFEINTGGVTWGSVYNSDYEFQFNHFWTTPVYREGTKLIPISYEPMYNKLTEDFSEPIDLNQRKYYPMSFRFF